MKGRRHGEGSRRRSPSPRRPMPRSRDFNNPRHRKYSPCGDEREEYSRDAERRGRIERRGQYDRDLDLRGGQRVSECENRDRARFVGGSWWSRSPLMIEKRDEFDRDSDLHGSRFSGYDNRDRVGDVVGARWSRSPLRIERRDDFNRDVTRGSDWVPHYDVGGRGDYKNTTSIGSSRISYDGDSYRRDLSPMKFQADHLLDGPRKPDHLNVTDYSQVPGHYGAGDANVIRDGGQRDDYWRSHFDVSSPHGSLLSSKYLDTTKSLYEGSGRVHSHSYMMACGSVEDMPRSNLSGGGSSSHISAVVSRCMNTGGDKQEYSRFHDELQVEKRDRVYTDRKDLYFEKESSNFCYKNVLLGIEKTEGREILNFRKESTLLSSHGYLNPDSDYMASSSRPEDHILMSLGRLREGAKGYSAMGEIHMPSHAIQPGSRLTSKPIAFDGYSEEKRVMSPRGPGGQSSYLGLPEEMKRDHLCTEFGRSNIELTKPENVEERYREQLVRRNDILNPSIDQSSCSKYMRNDEIQERYPFSNLESTPHKFDGHRPLLTKKQDLDMLGTGSSGFSYGTEGFRQYGSVLPNEHDTEIGGGLWSNGYRSDVIPSRGSDPLYGGVNDSPRKRLALRELSLTESSSRRLCQKQVSDELLHEHSIGIKISTDGNGSRKIYNQSDEGGEIGPVKFSKKPESNKSKYRGIWRESREMAIRPSSSKFTPSHSVKPFKSNSRDIKKRLGPVSHKLQASHRLAKKYKSSIKKRLQPMHTKKNATLPWLKNRSSKQVTSVTDDLGGIPHDQDGSRSRDHLSLAKPEPPEKSEDFKQMVQSAFFKFLKGINETPMKQKKYKNQGKASNLKCIVCGSESQEFIDTESLAMHAFTSEKLGLRSQHLGLHRALCVVMGWKFTEEVGKEWHPKVMSNAEVFDVKEDLIVWPPVVIVHNCTIDSKSSNERVIVTAENLHMKLKEMGLSSILKVCNGKPANQSVMLVKFNGTLSGLQEALRYHQNYTQSKHGRTELKQLNSKMGSYSERTHPNTEANILYGYLGLLEDLDKLDFDTKKRCIMRSKKEILSIANP